MPNPQPKLTDRDSWKRIGNTAMFFTGWICFMFWLFNGLLCPDPNWVMHGRTWVHIQPAVEPQHLGAFGLWIMNYGLLMFIPLLSFSVYNFLCWKKLSEATWRLKRSERDAEARWKDKLKGQKRPPTEKKHVPTGPRDTGPLNPPPWPQLVMAAMGVITCLAFATLGTNHEWIGEIYVRGPSAILTVSGMMFAMGFAFAAMDEARARGEYDHDDEN